MLDAAFIRDNLDAVKANCRNRNVKADVDRVVAPRRRAQAARQRDAGPAAAGQRGVQADPARRRTRPRSRS